MRRLALGIAFLLACSTDTFVGPDGGSADAAPPDDAGHADASGEAGVADACAGFVCTAGLCASFDQSLELPFADNSTGGGATAITTDHAVSCPAALEADLPQTGASFARAAASAMAPASTGTTAHVVVDAYVWLPANANGAFAAMAIRSGASDQVQITHDTSNSWHLHVGASDRDAPITPVEGAWNHMILDVTFSSDTGVGQASLTYDGGQPAVIDDRTMTSSVAGTVSVELGLAGTAVGQAMKAFRGTPAGLFAGDRRASPKRTFRPAPAARP